MNKIIGLAWLCSLGLSFVLGYHWYKFSIVDTQQHIYNASNNAVHEPSKSQEVDSSAHAVNNNASVFEK